MSEPSDMSKREIKMIYQQDIIKLINTIPCISFDIADI